MSISAWRLFTCCEALAFWFLPPRTECFSTDIYSPSVCGKHWKWQSTTKQWTARACWRSWLDIERSVATLNNTCTAPTEGSRVERGVSHWLIYLVCRPSFCDVTRAGWVWHAGQLSADASWLTDAATERQLHREKERKELLRVRSLKAPLKLSGTTQDEQDGPVPVWPAVRPPPSNWHRVKSLISFQFVYIEVFLLYFIICIVLKKKKKVWCYIFILKTCMFLFFLSVWKPWDSSKCCYTCTMTIKESWMN